VSNHDLALLAVCLGCIFVSLCVIFLIAAPF